MSKSIKLFRYIFVAAILAAWIALPGFSAHAAQPFELHLLDVGQGQCALIEADGHYMLMDGGGRSSSSFVVSYLKQQGIEYFDEIALSHYDEDHMSGLVGVLSVFPVNQILLPPYAGEGELYQEQGSDPLFLWQTRLRILRCMMQETGVCYHMRQRWRCCLRSQSNYNE